jgi:hypothetical protein
MTKSTNKPGIDFWIIGIVALLWNLSGVYFYLQQAYMTEEDLLALPLEQQPFYQNIPAWVTGAFAIAVFGGTLGCILLLMRKKLATTLFLVSLVGIVVQMIYNVFMSGALEVLGTGVLVMPVTVLLIGVFLLWYSRKKEAEGILS